MKRVFISLLLILISQSVLADYITQNITNGCDSSVIGIDSNNHSNIFAILTPNQHTCPSGQYLPANIDGCRTCGTEHTCPGGTYTFNESSSHGIKFNYPFTQSQTNACINDIIGADNNNHVNMFAVFTPNQHTCSAGYYLPANTDECRPCLKDNKCTGGTYTFNETTNQGIEPCTGNTLHAPAGSAVCYPHVLHLSSERPNDVIYLKSVATTSPAFNIDLNDDGTADAFANMTTTKTRMTNASEHYLKLTVNGVLYYVCDDTSCPSAN